MEQKITQKRKQIALMKELTGYEQSGARLYLDGCPSRADEIVRACLISEDTDYMRDFISDDGIHISEIHFLKVDYFQK